MARSAVIVGAGIGGLAAGLVLQRAGWHVRILERATSPRELGFALALAPNALAALREIGLADTVIRDGTVVRIGPNIAALTTTRSRLRIRARNAAIRLAPGVVLSGTLKLHVRDPHRTLRTSRSV